MRHRLLAGLLMTLDVGNNIADSADLFRVLVRDLHVVFFFQGHHQFNNIQGVSPQIFNERCFWGDLFLADAELFTDDLFHPCLDRACHNCVLLSLAHPDGASRTTSTYHETVCFSSYTYIPPLMLIT